MGKSLIIKGADFSANAINSSIEWYNRYNSLIGNKPTNTSATIAPFPTEMASLQGKVIRYIKLYSRNDGKISIVVWRVNSAPGVSPVDIDIVIPEQIYNVFEGVNTIRLNNEFILGSNETIGFKQGSNEIFTFNNSTKNEGMPYMNATTYPASNTNKLVIEFGHDVID